VVTAAENTGLHQLITEQHMAILCEPENEDAFYQCLSDHIGKDNQKTKENARYYADHYLEVNKILLGFEKLLLSLN
jgi:hypothetical protein